MANSSGGRDDGAVFQGLFIILEKSIHSIYRYNLGNMYQEYCLRHFRKAVAFKNLSYTDGSGMFRLGRVFTDFLEKKLPVLGKA